MPTIATAVGGDRSDDVLGLLMSHASAVNVGEVTWLKQLGITPNSWSH